MRSYRKMRKDKDIVKKIWETDWKYLIILDACRYDYFERIYRDYLPTGNLEKIISCATDTIGWLKKVFGNRNCTDIIYISANPFVNSRGITFHKGLNPEIFHFYKIIDVWDWRWSDELGTVHPREVNKAVLISLRLYRDKRYIIHYMQPHHPYISLASRGIRPHYPRISDRIKGAIRWKIFAKILGMERGLSVARKVLGPPPDYLSLLAREIGVNNLRRAYEENLRIVLSHVAALIKHLRGKIVITSDHGELLGERGLYHHFSLIRAKTYYGLNNVNFPELLEVPWLEIGTV